MTTAADRFADTLILLRTWSVPVTERAGWRTNSARSDIAFTPAAIINHHTGSPNTTDRMLFVDGNGIVGGPLCHFTIYPDGMIVLGAGGYANHAGINNKAAVELVAAGPAPAAQITPGPDTPGYSGNRRTVGIEVKASGSFNPGQRAAAVALNAALVLAFGWSRTKPPVGAHKEITRRKPGDPGDDMAAFRRDVVAFIAAKTTPAVPAVPVVPAPDQNPVKPALVPTLARVGTFNCGGWGRTSMTARQIDRIVGVLLKLNASIYALTECPEWLRDHIRGACECPAIAHRRMPGGPTRWLVRVRGSQAILRDSRKWVGGAFDSGKFGPTDYHGWLWEVETNPVTGASFVFGCYHLPPNVVSTQNFQRDGLQTFLAALPTGPRLIGGDGADDTAWFTGMADARTEAKASPDRTAKTYKGKSISDRIHAKGIAFRKYTVVPSGNPLGTKDHDAVLAQITIPTGVVTN